MCRSRLAGSKLDLDQKHEGGCNEVQVYCRKGQIEVTDNDELLNA